jgi:hypothetical protein
MPEDPEVFEVDKQKYDDLADGYGGIWLACGEFYERAIDPKAEDEECPSCGEATLYGIEQALYLERVRLVKRTGPPRDRRCLLSRDRGPSVPRLPTARHLAHLRKCLGRICRL